MNMKILLSKILSKIFKDNFKIFLLLSLLISSYMAFNSIADAKIDITFDNCKYCHAAVSPLQRMTNDCQVCHNTHGSNVPPSTRIPNDVHRIHSDVSQSGTNKGRCTNCHEPPSVPCERCHPNHVTSNLTFVLTRVDITNTNTNSNSNNSNNTNNTNNTNKVNNSRNQNYAYNYSDCPICHGGLPKPYGHDNFRNALSQSSHKWMTCKTCHLEGPKNGSINLHFKDLFQISLNKENIVDSIQLCKICHSLQYGQLEEGKHGTTNQTCIECHNPHTTNLAGPSFELNPKKFNLTSTLLDPINGFISSTTNKFPILQNQILLFVMFMVILASLLEYFLSRKEKDTKVTYNMVKIHGEEEKLKTLEIYSINPLDINEILREYADISGFTMTKDTRKVNEEYKYVVFVNLKKEEKSLIDIISSMTGVRSVDFTDKYDL